MLRIVPLVPNAMIREAPFPYFHPGARLFHELMGKSAFDELHGFLQRHKWSGSQEQMKVIRHEHEFIESKCSALAISIDRLNKQFRGPLRTKNGPALPRNGRHEECTIRKVFHSTAAESRILWSRNSQGWKPCASTVV